MGRFNKATAAAVLGALVTVLVSVTSVGADQAASLQTAGLALIDAAVAFGIIYRVPNSA